MEDFKSGQLNLTQPLTKESNLWYHPTLWSYLYLWITKGIK